MSFLVGSKCMARDSLRRKKKERTFIRPQKNNFLFSYIAMVAHILRSHGNKDHCRQEGNHNHCLLVNNRKKRRPPLVPFSSSEFSLLFSLFLFFLGQVYYFSFPFCKQTRNTKILPDDCMDHLAPLSTNRCSTTPPPSAQTVELRRRGGRARCHSLLCFLLCPLVAIPLARLAHY